MKIVCYAEPTEKGLLLHYPSIEISKQLLHLWEGARCVQPVRIKAIGK